MIVRFLIKIGIDVNAKGADFGTALYNAAENGQESIARLLIEEGADVNAQGGQYGDALKAAISKKHKTLVQVLLEKGADISRADVNAQGGQYDNALKAAISKKHTSFLHQVLLKKFVDISREHANILLRAFENWDESIAQILIDYGANVNAPCIWGEFNHNALCAAIHSLDQTYRYDIVLFLVKNGVSVNTQGGYYGNALQSAAAAGKIETVQLLIDNGADINAQGGVLW
jgi:ankyrin repeat protein